MPEPTPSSDPPGAPVRVSVTHVVVADRASAAVQPAPSEARVERPSAARTLPQIAEAPPAPPATPAASSPTPARRAPPPRATPAPTPPTPPTRAVAARPPVPEAARHPSRRDGGRTVRIAVFAGAMLILGAVFVRAIMEGRQARPLAPARPPITAPPIAAEPEAPAAAPSSAVKMEPQAPTPAPPGGELAPSELAPGEPAPSEPGAPSEAPEVVAAPAASALLEQARALEKAGKPRQALELLEQAVALDPNAPEALSRLAFGYLNRGENLRAAEFAARAVAVDPTSSEGWIVLGAARDATGDGKGARDAYRNCVEIGKGEYVTECRRVAR